MEQARWSFKQKRADGERWTQTLHWVKAKETMGYCDNAQENFWELMNEEEYFIFIKKKKKKLKEKKE